MKAKPYIEAWREMHDRYSLQIASIQQDGDHWKKWADLRSDEHHQGLRLHEFYSQPFAPAMLDPDSEECLFRHGRIHSHSIPQVWYGDFLFSYGPSPHIFLPDGHIIDAVSPIILNDFLCDAARLQIQLEFNDRAIKMLKGEK